MINDIDEINVVIQDNDSISVNEGSVTDISEIVHNEEIRQANEAQRIINENGRILNEDSREDYIADLKQKVEDGDFDGEDGTDGVDGISPTVNMTKQGKVTTLIITDKDGEHTTEIRDGNDGSGTGDMLKVTYDTNDNGVVDNAEKVNNHTVNSDVPANAVFTDTTYTAGTGIDITNNVISSTQSSAEWGKITGTLSDQTDLQNALDNKQDKIDSTHKLDADLVDDTNASNKFLTTSAQDIWGKKTFQSLPEYAYTANPVLDTQFVHKKYVDGKFMYQRDIMPTASSDFYNKIFQYTGITNANYINGYFYKCERSGTSPDYTYSWVRTDVQPGSTVNWGDILGTLSNQTDLSNALGNKQDIINSSNKLSSDLVDDSGNTNKFVTASEKTTWSGKQDALVSGTNIKTINNTSLLGSGNIDVEVEVDDTVSTTSTNPIENQAITNYVNSITTNIWENIDTSGWTKNPSNLTIGYAKYNKITKEVWITAYSANGVNNTTTIISGIQAKYRPSVNIQQNANGLGCWVSTPNTNSPFARIDATIKSAGEIQLFFPVGATMYQLGIQIRYIAE